MTTETDLRRAIETAFVHLRPGGAALFAPDFVRENFRESTDHGGHDGGERSLRYLEWTWDPDPNDTTYMAEYAFMLREGREHVRVVHDRHAEGLFARADWLGLMSEVGFDAKSVPFTHSEIPDTDLEVFVGTLTP
jgi:hypothetical protein